MALSDFLFGKKEQMQQVPTMDPQQQALLSQLLGGIGGATGAGLSNLQALLSGDQGAFEAFEAPIKTQFSEEIIPQLAERFSGAGAQRSSVFQQQLGSAGANLSQQLAALRGQLQQSAMSQLTGLLGTGLGARTQENILRPGTQGLLGGLAGGIGSGIGSGFGMAGGIGLSKLFGL